MKILCKNYIHSYNFYMVDFPSFPDNFSNYDFERILAPKQQEKIIEKEITIYDSDSTNENKLYLELSACNEVDNLISFCQKYGTLINPYNYSSNNSNRDFPVLKDLIKQALKKLHLSSAAHNCTVLVYHLEIYQHEIDMLVRIHSFLSNKLTQESMFSFISYCHDFFFNDYFFDLICLEYSNVLDDDIEKIFNKSPICHLRFFLSKTNFDITEEKALKELLKSASLKENDIDYLLKIITCEDPAVFNFKYDKKAIQNVAHELLSDLLQFHCREINAIQMMANYNDSLCFTSLADAIFYQFHIDLMGGTLFRKCADPKCGKIFTCQKGSRKKYCDSRCAKRVASRNYKERQKSKNISQ